MANAMRTDETSTAESEGSSPVISMVMPVYNGERFLREALDSVLAQTFTDFELIAVDDCSTDATPAILAEYAAREPRITVISQPDNRKLPASLNTGFAAARGSWFSWTSDDNILEPTMLEHLFAETTRAPEADIVYSDYRVIDKAGDTRGFVTVGSGSRLVSDNVVGCCFLYRREVDAKLGGYDEALFGLEDYDFWLRARKAGFVFHPIHHVLYHYRRHSDSLSDTRARQIRAMIADTLPQHIQELDRSPLRAEARLRFATRDPYTVRATSLLQAFIDHPPTVVRSWREIGHWAWTSVKMRFTR